METASTQNEKYDYGVSFVRFIATFMIVGCHILQHYGQWTAFWFNCGVQSFIFISGFLYGQRRIENGYIFIKKRLYRILLDYYVCLAIDLIVYYSMHREMLTWDGMKGLLFFNNTIEGLGHLWFIPTICFLYIATPAFLRILDDLESHLNIQTNNKIVAKIAEFVILWFLFIWIGKFIGVLSYVNCWIYTLGLMAGRNKAKEPEKRTWLKLGCGVAVPLTGIGTTLCILYKQMGKIPFFASHADFYSRWFYPLNHAALGIAVFCVLYLLEEKLGLFRRISHVPGISDKYSYDVYLSHHIWVQDPVSLFNLPFSFIPKLIITGIVISIHTISVRFFSEYIDRNIVKKLAIKRRVSLELISAERNAIMGFSIIWIMFFHSSYDVSAIAKLLKNYGNIGVDFFLFLSAVGLYYSLSNRNNIVHFYKKRVIRVLPATVICLTPWIAYLSATGRKISALRFVLDITSLGFWIDGFNRGWYVALTLVLYLLYPLIYKLIRADDFRRNIARATVLIIIDIALNIILQKVVPDWYLAVELAMTRVPVFLVGSFLAPCVYKKKEISYTAVFLMAVVVVTSFWILTKQSVYKYSIYRYIYMVITACIIPVAAIILHRVNKSNIHRFLSWIGRYTLEIYLIHTQVLSVMTQEIVVDIPHKVFLINSVAIIGSVALAVVVNRILTPLIRRVG